MSSLTSFLEQSVKVITTDGRLFIVSKGQLLSTNWKGHLEGFDKNVNIILSQAKERIFDPVETTITMELGLYIIRGDNVVCIGDVDEEIERNIDWEKVHGDTLRNTKNPL